MGLIIDLDQTIVDSSAGFALRDARQWNEVYKKISEFTLYPGIGDLLREVNKMMEICVWTTSPRSYAERVVKHFDIPTNHYVCYHDTVNKKPHADPTILALKLLGKQAQECIVVGDHPKDIISGRDAGVKTVAAFWGAIDHNGLVSASADYNCHKIDDLRKIIEDLYGSK